jgi:hypothetical protein
MIRGLRWLLGRRSPLLCALAQKTTSSILSMYILAFLLSAQLDIKYYGLQEQFSGIIDSKFGKFPRDIIALRARAAEQIQGNVHLVRYVTPL